MKKLRGMKKGYYLDEPGKKCGVRRMSKNGIVYGVPVSRTPKGGRSARAESQKACFASRNIKR